MTDTRSPVRCPDCAGAGKVTAHLLTTTGGRWEDVACDRCKGEGRITADEMERYVTGRAMAEDRKARGMTLRAEATRLNLSPRALSDLEWGRV